MATSGHNKRILNKHSEQVACIYLSHYQLRTEACILGFKNDTNYWGTFPALHLTTFTAQEGSVLFNVTARHLVKTGCYHRVLLLLHLFHFLENGTDIKEIGYGLD
jgi:hypothetical protein